ncbi:uncharacterized protein LOC132174280 [Corylus avellana]|uniref:uncharacterized protein LOC132174280 n=1 Tax=Corylus avellana TaxID=13451 RepID=UPI00286D4905|nr:uncharacterized protein LOC132174280 [Corylus avellana]
MKKELDALYKNNAWDLVDLPHGKYVVGCKWVYKIKTCFDGTVDMYNARLVAHGFTQEYSVDYEETFALVARLSFVHALLAITASRHWFFISVELYMDLSRHLKHGLLSLVPLSLALATPLALMIQPCLFAVQTETSKIVDTPTELNTRLTPHDGEPLRDFTLYWHLVGSLIYLIVTRHDISYAVHQSPLQLHAYTVADWAGDPTDHHSTTGYCFLLGEDMGVSLSSAIPVYCDNKSAIHISHNDVFHEDQTY